MRHKIRLVQTEKELEEYGFIMMDLIIDDNHTDRRLLFKLKDDRLYFIDVVSTRFVLLPHRLVKEIADEITENHGLTLFKHYYTGSADEIQYLWYINMKEKMYLAGDEHYAGVMIRSAENNRSSIFVCGLIIRNVGENGLAVPYNSTRIIRVLSQSLLRGSLEEKLDDAIRIAMIASKEVARHIDLSQKVPVTEEMIKKLRVSLSNGGRNGHGSSIPFRILKNDFIVYDDGEIFVMPDHSLYDLYCRVTEYATMVRRPYYFERITSRLCELIVKNTNK